MQITYNFRINGSSQIHIAEPRILMIKSRTRNMQLIIFSYKKYLF